MIYVKQEFEHENEQYVLMQLHTSCCKDQLIFRKLKDGGWYDMQKLYDCSEHWNALIDQALENKRTILKKE